MSTEAKLKNDEGKSEGFGLSILDVVKHAVKTLIHNLEAYDRLAIVEYSTNSRVVLNLTNMDA